MVRLPGLQKRDDMLSPLLQTPPAASTVPAANATEPAAPAAAIPEEDSWAAFMDAANPPASASGALQPAADTSDDHWDAFQVDFPSQSYLSDTPSLLFKAPNSFMLERSLLTMMLQSLQGYKYAGCWSVVPFI